ncbi:MAG: methionine--tRNA ligase subunit beta, partial [Parachlamydia sp.]|nr:methionine--tRNA ligase subunit beta [Parachlamydia sp.]
KHWFLLLEKFKERLIEWINEKNWKPNVVNFIRGYIDHLHARAITRDMNWGIPVPVEGAQGKVLYVWFDAPIGYISATKEWAQLIGEPDKWKEFWMNSETLLVNFIGKDNIPFHASIFPAMEMGQNQPYKLVDELPANEFYNLEGRQFSKSEGWYIDLEDFFKNFSSDQIRYTIAANAPETADSEFTWKDFQARCNGDLLGKYGNLANRILVFIQNKCGGTVPEMGALEEVDEAFLNHIQELVDLAAENYNTFKLRRASQIVMELAQTGNVYFDTKKPWKDAKEASTEQRMKTTLACCMVCLKALALISFPIIPATANKLWSLMGFEGQIAQRDWNDAKNQSIPAGQKIQPPEVLFQKIEDELIELEIKKLHELSKKTVTAQAQEKTPLAPLKEMIEIEDFQKLDLRVGVIRKAARVKKSKKLLELQVDIGLEERTIAAGIGEYEEPDQLIGRKVVVVANLKPATLMGVTSQGMLLAGKEPGSIQFVAVDMEPGTVVC